MKKADLRIGNGIAVTLDPQRRIIKDASVVIDDGKIIAIDKTNKIDTLCEGLMTEDNVYWSSMLTCLENIRAGTTCACEPGGRYMDRVGQAYKETGLWGIISWLATEKWSDEYGVLDHLAEKKPIKANLAKMEGVVQNWHGAAKRVPPSFLYLKKGDWPQSIRKLDSNQIWFPLRKP